MTNIASALRPTRFEEFIGQEHLVGNDGVFQKFIDSSIFPHAILYGPPGTGKTTLAKLAAESLGQPISYLNATSIKVEEIRKIAQGGSLLKPLIFIDEIHRLSKNQQEVLLPILEENIITLIGASTENPFFSLTQALRSRILLFEFKKLTKRHLGQILDNALSKFGIQIGDDAYTYLLESSNGDARAMLNLLEFSSKLSNTPTLADLKRIRPFSLSEGSSEDDTHYDLASALIKSIRGSDPDAAIYYLARLIECGENPEFIARRLTILAAEDIGLANPNALNLATSCMLSVSKIGYPEASILLSECALYLCASPKSNTAYKAIKSAQARIRNGEIYDTPKNITHFNENYLYPHDFGGWVEQKYVDERFKVVELSDIGFEKKLKEWLGIIKKHD